MPTVFTDLCQELRNWFIRSQDDIHEGDFVIRSGKLMDSGFLKENQYFRIEGSIFNDGVWQHGVDELTDEEFTGRVSGMAVPPAVVALAKEIGEWVAQYGATVSSPYTSESWGGYSYSKGGYGSTNGAGSSNPSWQSTFASRLNRWRKV